MGSNVDSTTLVAWWGAVVATGVLIWDVVKWRMSGPRLRVTVSPNMEFLGPEIRDSSRYVIVNVVNTGDRPTTLTHLCLGYFDSRFQRLKTKLLRKPKRLWYFSDPGATSPLPHVLNPGMEWKGKVNQSEKLNDRKLEELAKAGHLVCQISHSCAKKPTETRIVLR